MKSYRLFLLLFFLTSCGSGVSDNNYQYDQLSRQLTPDGKHYMYNYEREGAFVTSNEISGRRLIKIDQSFKEDGGVDVTGVIDHWVNDTLIIHVYQKNAGVPKDTLVIKTECESYDGVTIKRIYEQPIVGGSIADELVFDSVKIDNNQMRFYGAKSRFDTTKYAGGERIFQSGEAIAYADSGFLTKITIEKQFKDMNFSRIDESGKKFNNQPEVLIKMYKFTPLKKIKVNSIGEKGIFTDYNLDTREK